MTRVCIVAALVGVLLVEAKALQQGTPPSSAPQVIYWPRVPDKPPTPVGLLYTPEHLADLARQSPEAVSARIAEAISRQTPIVVLWTIPPNANSGPWPRPFSAVIVENGGMSCGTLPRVEPVWADQHADDLRQLDPMTTFDEVGVMAAFPRSAFVPGRFVNIYVSLRTEVGAWRCVQRFGLIDWSGIQPHPTVSSR